MLMALAGEALYLERRPAAGIWGGLWSFPEIEDSDIDGWCVRRLGAGAGSTDRWQPLRHSFSHYDLDIHPVLVRLQERSQAVADTLDSTWLALEDQPPGGIARPVQKLIDELKKATHGANG